jgi:hypothetical protein
VKRVMTAVGEGAAAVQLVHAYFADAAIAADAVGSRPATRAAGRPPLG